MTDAEKKELSGRVRVPKAIVFSLHDWDLQVQGFVLFIKYCCIVFVFEMSSVQLTFLVPKNLDYRT